MVELVQYFVLCCGCRATITMEMFQNEDTTSVIRSLTENFDEASWSVFSEVHGLVLLFYRTVETTL